MFNAVFLLLVAAVSYTAGAYHYLMGDTEKALVLGAPSVVILVGFISFMFALYVRDKDLARHE